MSDLETMLAPLLDSAPEPPPLASLSARASGIRRRRRARVTVLSIVVVGAVVAGIAAALPRDGNGVGTVGRPTVTRPAASLSVGRPLEAHEAAIDVVSAYGSLWISQPDRVARLDPADGSVIARVRVPGESDFRNLAVGAGSIWVDDTGTETVTRIDPATNRVVASISMRGSEFVPDGIAFLDGKLWVARPVPNDTTRGDIVAIDPATNRTARHGTIPRTFDVLAGPDALWYVSDGANQLLRLDPKTLQTTVVRRDATRLLAIIDGRIWLEIVQGVTARGVIEIDDTGRQIGRDIPLGSLVNTTIAVADGVIWLAWQSDSSTPGTMTAYDAVTRRAISKPLPVGLPITNVVTTPGAVWVATYTPNGLARFPFSRA
jgi:virginiamycin B lyase